MVPSGLIRYGMAPDHEKIKKVADDLLAIDKNPSFKFFGGVEIVNLIGLILGQASECLRTAKILFSNHIRIWC